jgi:capsular polysaccharide biosynthesis protein
MNMTLHLTAAPHVLPERSHEIANDLFGVAQADLREAIASGNVEEIAAAQMGLLSILKSRHWLSLAIKAGTPFGDPTLKLNIL